MPGRSVCHSDLAFAFEHRNLDGLRNTLEKIFSRLTMGVILGALIIGSSLIITTESRRSSMDIPCWGSPATSFPPCWGCGSFSTSSAIADIRRFLQRP